MRLKICMYLIFGSSKNSSALSSDINKCGLNRTNILQKNSNPQLVKTMSVGMKSRDLSPDVHSCKEIYFNNCKKKKNSTKILHKLIFCYDFNQLKNLDALFCMLTNQEFRKKITNLRDIKMNECTVIHDLESFMCLVCYFINLQLFNRYIYTQNETFSDLVIKTITCDQYLTINLFCSFIHAKDKIFSFVIKPYHRYYIKDSFEKFSIPKIEIFKDSQDFSFDPQYLGFSERDSVKSSLLQEYYENHDGKKMFTNSKCITKYIITNDVLQDYEKNENINDMISIILLYLFPTIVFYFIVKLWTL
ncbi:hypothetical protein EDEG_03047 [Edhazardia aedis USNM 41457]|uniref:Uncharacterized protein n=1 Tax=Edhazardia aedis (strain USNM 41457) TaxID=1003232 RepID=J9DIU9_EDHAE|nr:hypothetical protein EDEG_03047 [Edhazardia aedis USNM 41457]|eukprot:EJW02535.2 hypothetical protein EDEG_03047 [Edhazardia aedis USNM 41457]